MFEVVVLGKVPRSPSKNRSFLEFNWYLSEGLSYIVLYIPRVKVSMFLVELI